jgi:hypothetical protein
LSFSPEYFIRKVAGNYVFRVSDTGAIKSEKIARAKNALNHFEKKDLFRDLHAQSEIFEINCGVNRLFPPPLLYAWFRITNR